MPYGTGGAYQFSSPPSATAVLAALVAQDIVARSYTATQVTGSNAFTISVDGARIKLSSAAAAIIYGDASRIHLGGLTAIDAVGGTALIIAQGDTINFGGPTLTNDGVTFKVGGALALTPSADQSINLGSSALEWSTFFLGGSLVLASTDSSGTPGNATINKPSGRSAIALGAATCTVSNTLVTAATRVFISARTRDATGLLPLVTTVAGGSFTVTTVGNCTAALVFDWVVIG